MRRFPPRFVFATPDLSFGFRLFPAAKYLAVRDAVAREFSLDCRVDFVDPPPATRAQIARVHSADYLDRLRHYAATAPLLAVAELEIPCLPETIGQIEHAVGGTIRAAEIAVETGTFGFHLGGGFHHAFADHGEGFCMLNDIAIAIRDLQHAGRIARATVIDLDAHQGNGTAAIFAGDASVTTISLHNAAIYPATKMASTVDVALPPHTGDEAYLAALWPVVESAISAAHPAPDLLVLVAGADPFAGDRLGGLALSKAGLRARDECVMRAARDRQIPVAVVLAGGYAVDAADVVEIHAATAAVCLGLWPAD